MEKIKIRQGLDIPLVGEPENKELGELAGATCVLYPDDFLMPGVGLRVCVSLEERVEIGTPIFQDKKFPDIVVTSPVSGQVIEISRGEKRKLLYVRILAEKEENKVEFTPRMDSAEDVAKFLMRSGLWVYFQQRPYGIIPSPLYKARDIYVMCGDSSPLAPDFYSLYGDMLQYVPVAARAISLLTTGKVYFVFDNPEENPSQAKLLEFVKKEVITGGRDTFDIIIMEGPHPACTLSVVINRHRPVNKGERVWGLTLEGLIRMGYAMEKKHLLNRRKVALGGSGWTENGYIFLPDCSEVTPVVEKFRKSDREYRIISGNVLTGRAVETKGAIHYYDNLLCAIPEGKYREFMGWALPSWKKFSNSRLLYSWLFRGRKYDIDTNMHGEERPFVVTGEYEKVFPMKDIWTQEFVKYCMVKDLDAMEELGGYEVVPEDFALCEFVCTSKVPLQRIVRDALNFMYKELE